MIDDLSSPTRSDKGENKPSPRRTILRILLVPIAGVLGLVAGFVSGMSFGGNYAPEFNFLGMPGYEGSALMAGVISGGMLLLISCFSVCLQRRLGTALFATVGGLVGVFFGAPLLFPIIAPSRVLLAFAYIGSASIGAAFGAAVRLLRIFPRDISL
jgi:hypothetical protein